LLFDPFLARGMDYYTGPVFEIAAEGVPFSLAGGGRYDELIGKLSGTPGASTPACGFSIGFERVYTLMEERGMFGTVSRGADVLLACPAEAAASRAVAELAAELRAQGLQADLFPGAAKPQKLFEYAEKKAIPFAIMNPSGADGMVEIRTLAKRENAKVARAELAAWVKKSL
jgi:histidyl-tRNA synthetase